MHRCLALQALGVPMKAAQYISDRAQANAPTFISRGPVEELVSQQPSLPQQWPKQIHRFPLTANAYAVSAAASWAVVCVTLLCLGSA